LIFEVGHDHFPLTSRTPSSSDVISAQYKPCLLIVGMKMCLFVERGFLNCVCNVNMTANDDLEDTGIEADVIYFRLTGSGRTD